MIPVTVVTANAGTDNLSEQDYRDIFDELIQHHSLRSFQAAIDSAYSHATWDKYKRGAWELTRVARNELRRAVGQPNLPLTVAESLADVDADAEVLAIGTEPKNRVFLASKGQSLIIYANGTVEARLASATSVTWAREKRTRREMSAEQAKKWDALSNEERDRVLGL